MKKVIVILLMLVLVGCSTTETVTEGSPYPIDKGTYIDYGTYIDFKSPADNTVKTIVFGDKVIVRVGTCSVDLKIRAYASNAYLALPDNDADYEVIEGGGTASGRRIYFGLDDQILRQSGYFIDVVVDGVSTHYIDLGSL